MAEETAEPQPGTEPNTITVPDAKITAPTKVVFGLNAVKLPNPDSANQFFTYFQSFAIIGALVANGFPEIPEQTHKYIMEGSLVIIAIVSKLKDLWGLSNSEA